MSPHLIEFVVLGAVLLLNSAAVVWAATKLSKTLATQPVQKRAPRVEAPPVVHQPLTADEAEAARKAVQRTLHKTRTHPVPYTKDQVAKACTESACRATGRPATPEIHALVKKELPSAS